ncbi:MAG: hypothetical protein LBD36_03340 [Holosporales bacterium]|jgi:hypothetical protein|nr:hypothetical protein [Holosporales bacterium]
MKNNKLIQIKLIKQTCVKYIDYLQILGNRYLIAYFGFSICVSSVTLCLWNSTKNIKNKAHIRTQEIIQRQETVQKLKENDTLCQKKLKSIGVHSNPTWIVCPSTTFSKLLTDIKNENRVTEVKYSLQKTGVVEKNAELFSLSLTMTLKSMRDQHIINFLAQLIERIPGVVLFERITIKRESEILSQAEFNKLLKCHDQIKQRLMPCFMSNVQCRIIMYSDMVSEFIS